MPIYEYRCASCGYENEYLQKVSDPLLTDCPECGKPTFSKLVSAAGFQLKGNGWYVTDFKNKDKDKGAKPSTAKEKSGGDGEKSAAEPEKAKESKADDKPASACAGACACT